jgi:hypothetical protein
VLKNGDKFPCITVHQPPSLQPLYTYCGSTALRDLELHLADAQQQQQQQHGGQAASSAQVAGLESVSTLTKGAAELKELLKRSSGAGLPCAVIWHVAGEGCEHLVAAVSSVLPGALHLHALPMRSPHLCCSTSNLPYKIWSVHFLRQSAADAVTATADPAGSKANSVLAGALGVKALPAVYVYRKMKLTGKVAGVEATAEGVQALLGTATQCSSGGAAAGVAVSSALRKAQTAHEGRPVPSSSPSAAALQGGVYDPPVGKYARPGMVKKLPDGRSAHFFPRMPCLKCGCPWWTSDEWNGRCVR